MVLRVAQSTAHIPQGGNNVIRGGGIQQAPQGMGTQLKNQVLGSVAGTVADNVVQAGANSLAGQAGVLGSAGKLLGGTAGGAGAAGLTSVLGPLALGFGAGKIVGLFNEGGEVPQQMQEMVQAVMSGEMPIEEFVQILMDMGIPPEQIQAIVQELAQMAQGMSEQPVQQAQAPQQAPLNPEGFNRGGYAQQPVRMNMGGPLQSNGHSPKPSHGNVIPAGGKVKKVSTTSKMKQGSSAQEDSLTLEFDTDNINFSDPNLVPPMSAEAKSMF